MREGERVIEGGKGECQGETEIRKERVHWVLQPPGATSLDDKTGDRGQVLLASL